MARLGRYSGCSRALRSWPTRRYRSGEHTISTLYESVNHKLCHIQSRTKRGQNSQQIYTFIRGELLPIFFSHTHPIFEYPVPLSQMIGARRDMSMNNFNDQLLLWFHPSVQIKAQPSLTCWTLNYNPQSKIHHHHWMLLIHSGQRLN